MHFTVGEAFVCCVQGLTSPHARDSWTVLESEFHPEVAADVLSARKSDLVWLLDELLNKLTQDPHPNSRQVCGLLCTWVKKARQSRDSMKELKTENNI